MRKVEDIAGQRFGMLVAKEYIGINAFALPGIKNATKEDVE